MPYSLKGCGRQAGPEGRLALSGLMITIVDTCQHIGHVEAIRGSKIKNCPMKHAPRPPEYFCT